MFKLYKDSQISSDCTMPYRVEPYRVELDKNYTVGQFIKSVLTRKEEWGEIGILFPGDNIFDCLKYEYKHGKLISDILPGDILDKEIIWAKAYGGCTLMDYYLKVKE